MLYFKFQVQVGFSLPLLTLNEWHVINNSDGKKNNKKNEFFRKLFHSRKKRNVSKEIAQPAFTSSKSTLVTPEQGVNSAQS